VNQSRTRTPSSDVEAAILAAAETILDTDGPGALSIRRIAAVAGVAPMGVYNHFESKNGVIEALFRSGFTRLKGALDSLREIDDPIEALLEGGRRYRALALEHTAAFQVMFLRAMPGFEPSDEAKAVAGDAFLSLTAAVDRAMQANVIVKGNPAQTAQMIWASIHGWVALELSGIGFVDDLDKGAEDLGRALLDGLRLHNAPPRAV